MKTAKAPLKATWDRLEFIKARNAVNKFNGIELEFPEKVRCSFCIKDILGKVVDVVEYGEKACCPSCFQARYRNRPQRYKHFPIPTDFRPTPEEAEKHKAEHAAAVEKAVDIQNENITQIRKSSSTVDPAAIQKKD